jgi:hypothetical protein
LPYKIPLWITWRSELVLVTKDGRQLVFSPWPSMHRVDESRLKRPEVEHQTWSAFVYECFGPDPNQLGSEVAAHCGFQFRTTPSRHFLKVEKSGGESPRLKHVKFTAAHAVSSLVQYVALPAAAALALVFTSVVYSLLHA